MALSDSAKETIEYMFTLTPKPGKAAMYGCVDTITTKQIADDFDDYCDVLDYTTDHEKLIITLGAPTQNASRYTKIHEKTISSVVTHKAVSVKPHEMIPDSA